MATIMLNEFCRMFGMGYLTSTLKALVTKVCRHPGDIEVWRILSHNSKISERHTNHVTYRLILLSWKIPTIVIRTFKNWENPPMSFCQVFWTLWTVYLTSSGCDFLPHSSPFVNDAQGCFYRRIVWQHLYKKVREYYPDEALKLVGGFLFLRFFCPAILAPHNFGLLEGRLHSW